MSKPIFTTLTIKDRIIARELINFIIRLEVDHEDTNFIELYRSLQGKGLSFDEIDIRNRSFRSQNELESFRVKQGLIKKKLNFFNKDGSSKVKLSQDESRFLRNYKTFAEIIGFDLTYYDTMDDAGNWKQSESKSDLSTETGSEFETSFEQYMSEYSDSDRQKLLYDAQEFVKKLVKVMEYSHNRFYREYDQLIKLFYAKARDLYQTTENAYTKFRELIKRINFAIDGYYKLDSEFSRAEQVILENIDEFIELFNEITDKLATEKAQVESSIPKTGTDDEKLSYFFNTVVSTSSTPSNMLVPFRRIYEIRPSEPQRLLLTSSSQTQSSSQRQPVLNPYQSNVSRPVFPEPIFSEPTISEPIFSEPTISGPSNIILTKYGGILTQDYYNEQLARLESLEQKLSSIEPNYQIMGGQLSEEQNRVRMQSKVIEELHNEIQSLKRKLATPALPSSSDFSQIEKLDKRIKDLEKNVASLENDKQGHLTRIKRLETEKEKLLEDSKLILKIMQGQALDSPATRNRRVDQLLDIERQYQSVSQELDTLNSFLGFEKTEVENIPRNVQKAIENINSRLKKAIAERSELKSILDRIPNEKEVESMRQQIRNYEKMISDLKAEKVAMERNLRLEQAKKLSDLDVQLQNANKEIERLEPIVLKLNQIQQQYGLRGDIIEVFNRYISLYQKNQEELESRKVEITNLQKENLKEQELRTRAETQLRELQIQYDLLEKAKAAAIGPAEFLLSQQQKTIDELRKKIIDAERDRDKYQQERDNYQQDKESYKKIANERLEQLDKYSAISRRKDELYVDLVKRYRSMAGIINDNVDLAADYSEEIDQLTIQIEAQRQNSQREIERLQNELRQANLGSEQFRNLQKELDDLKRNSAANIQTLEARLKDIQNERNTLEEDNQVLRDKERKARKDKEDLQNLVNQLQAEKSKVFRNDAAIKDLEEKIKDQAAIIKFQENTLDMSQENVQILERTRDRLQADINRLTQENADLLAQIAAGPLIVPAGGAPAPAGGAPAPAPAPAPGGGGGGGGGAARIAPAPNIFPGNNMNVVARGQDLTYFSQIDQFLSDLTVAILSAVDKNRAIQWNQQPLQRYRINNWQEAQDFLKQRGMVDLGDITENPKGLIQYMKQQNVQGNVRGVLGKNLFDLKVLPLRYKLKTSEYEAGPAVKTIATLPSKQRAGTSDLGTIVVPGQSNYSLRRQGLNYVVTSAGKSQSFGSERDANYFIQTGGFGRKTYGPITERVFGTPIKNVSQAIY